MPPPAPPSWSRSLGLGLGGMRLGGPVVQHVSSLPASMSPKTSGFCSPCARPVPALCPPCARLSASLQASSHARFFRRRRKCSKCNSHRCCRRCSHRRTASAGKTQPAHLPACPCPSAHPGPSPRLGPRPRPGPGPRPRAHTARDSGARERGTRARGQRGTSSAPPHPTQVVWRSHCAGGQGTALVGAGIVSRD